MADIKKEETQKQTTVTEKSFQSDAPRRFRSIPLLLLLLVIIGGLIYGGIQLFKKDEKKEEPKKEQAFEYKPVLGDPNNPQPFDGVKIRDNQPGQVAGVQEPAPVAQPVQQVPVQNTPVQNRPVVSAPTNTDYINNGAGFRFVVPAGSNIVQGGTSANQVTFYNSHTRQLHGWVDIFANTDNSTLDTIYKQLAGSQDIYNIHYTTFGGQSAIRYTARSTGQSTVVVIFGGRIYYINGNLISSPIADTFRFI